MEKCVETPNKPSHSCSGPEWRPSKAALSLEPDGWVLRLLPDGGEIRYTGDLLSDEFNRWLAEKLGIPPGEAWKLKEKDIDQWWPRNLDEVRRLFPRIVGEDDNVKLLILSLFSLKLRNPSDRLMGVIIEASNSAGKSHIAREILKPLRPLDLVLEFTRMTGAYLERKFNGQNLDRKILFMQEMSGAPAQLHLALSEGKLHIGLVERVDGHFEPMEITCEGQPFLVLTTTGWNGSQDLLHRCITINLDESPEQTRRIIEFQSRLNSDLAFRDAFEKFAAGCEKMFRRLWKEAPENVKVIIPFLPLLEEKLESVEGLDVRIRRDFNKLIALIKASAILFYKNRPLAIKEENGLKDVVIVATSEDLENVLPLISSSMRQVLSNVSEKELRVLEAMRQSDMGSFTYSELAKLTGLPSSSLRHWIIPRLEAKGYLILDRETRPHRIELAKKRVLDTDLHVDPAEAEKLLKDCLCSLASLGYADGHGHNRERSPEMASDSQKKPEGLAAIEMANDLSLFSEKPESGSDSENTPGELAISTAANDLSSFSENKAETGEISRLWPWPRDKEDVMRIWRPGPGACEECGEYASELYPVKVAGGWTRLLCRACASEAILIGSGLRDAFLEATSPKPAAEAAGVKPSSAAESSPGVSVRDGGVDVAWIITGGRETRIEFSRGLKISPEHPAIKSFLLGEYLKPMAGEQGSSITLDVEDGALKAIRISPGLKRINVGEMGKRILWAIRRSSRKRGGERG
ncbi:MAG: hypothetical protein QXI18_01635 [Nitrososphaerota archaeon]